MIKAKIAEVFESIQGEGLYQGAKQIFVRFFGCNLACQFCDTKLYSYQNLDANFLLREIKKYNNYHSISLTGGEPLLHCEFLQRLLEPLKKDAKIVYLETNSTLPEALEKVISWVDIVAMDFKLPSSTGIRSFWQEHREFLKIASRKKVFVKTIVGNNTSRSDILKSCEIIRDIKPDITLVLQPENPLEDILEEKLISFSDLCQGKNIRVKVIAQLHKKLGIK